MTELLHSLSHAGGPLEFTVFAFILTVFVHMLWRRARLRAALLLGVPGLLFLALALDLERLWPVPSLMRSVSLVEPGRYEFEVAGSNSLLWKRRVCLSLQVTPGIPSAGPPVAAEVRYALADPVAGEIAERAIRSGEWLATFSPIGGDGGMLCAAPPKRFRAGLEVHEGDIQFEPMQTRLVVSVPRHHIVCPERLRGAALAAGIVLLLGSGLALLLHRHGALVGTYRSCYSLCRDPGATPGHGRSDEDGRNESREWGRCGTGLQRE